eukprot:scaffold90296_cov68-Phaeocystis_antarctica.AAC.16
MACCQSAGRAARSCDTPQAARPRPVAASEWPPPAGGRLHRPAARSGASASNGGVSSTRGTVPGARARGRIFRGSGF